MDISDLGSLGDLAKQMKNAYSNGETAMNKAGKTVKKDIKPDHEIKISLQLEALVEGHEYAVDAEIIFEIELEPILNSETGDLSSLLDNLGVDMGDDKDSIMEQLDKPRAIGVVKATNLKKLKLSNTSGQIDSNLNGNGTILATLDEKTLKFNFESVLSYPKHNDVYMAIPSTEMMQQNIQIDVSNLNQRTEFKWIEEDKDNLKVSGWIEITNI